MRQQISALAAILLASSALAQTRTIEAAASISPQVPAIGENRLEVVLTEGGKPLTGVRLDSKVFMTNMDMGVAHPPVKETSPGHYVLRPTLLMGGPWRVTLATRYDPKFFVNFDITVGSKQPWKPAKQKVAIGGTNVPEPPKSAPPKMEPPRTEPPKQEQPKYEPPQKEAPKTEPPKQEQPGYGGHGGHAASTLPQLKEKSSYAWQDGMDFETRSGFGKLEPMVRMMILMMVGGSGMEGMKMAPMEMKFDEMNFVESGDEPMKNMPGMNMGDKALKVKADLGSAKVGDNNVAITITTPDGKPVEKAKITASVAMTSMDMGTTKPAVKELGKGRYALKANFSMMGPWRLTLTIAMPDMQPSIYTFDFEAK